MSVYVLATSMPRTFIDSKMDADPLAEPMEELIEFAGRTCYQSYDKPNAKTSRNQAYMANILAQGHESVLEHSSITFYVEGYSRNMLLELERHRHLSFSVESQRFVDAIDTPYVIPKALEGDAAGYFNHAVRTKIELAHIATRVAYLEVEEALDHLPRKQRREAARSILPGGLMTRFVVTGNLRAWRDVLKKRHSVHADAEIRDFASVVLQLLKNEAPNVFQDFPDAPFE